MTEKRKYEKPSQRVIELQYRTMLLAGSNGGLRGKDYDPEDDPFADE